MLQPGSVVHRHPLPVRLWHWTNLFALTIMLMSGLMIFNAHPRLYWGEYGANPDHAWLEIGNRGLHGELRIENHVVPTTGVLGISKLHGMNRARAFPGWATIPTDYSLADARLWHLAFAWVLVLALLLFQFWALLAGHLARDLHIRLGELTPRHLWQEVKDHARLRFPEGAEALHYNTLQKLAYGSVIYLLLPLMVITGLAMAPGMDAALPGLSEVFGGRQSARSVHFLAATGLVLFFLVHIAMVVLSGPLNQVRAMLTGRYRLPGKVPVDD
jgi:thiosulfate reductase cytochrome b subunit